MNLTQEGEAAAVVLRAGSRYLTCASVPDPESLEVLRVEKVPTEWVPGDYQRGDVFGFPIDGSQVQATTFGYLPALSDWQQWAEEEGSYQELRSICAEEGINAGANPSTEEMINALCQAQVYAPGAEHHDSTEPLTYNPLELAQGIEEAAGDAAEEALDILERQVEQYEKKLAVVQDYQRIQQPGSPFEQVRDVADAHEMHWRTVHRYVDELLDEDERIVGAQAG